MKPRTGARLSAEPIGPLIATGDEDHDRARVELRKLPGELEAIELGKLDVQEDHGRVQSLDLLDHQRRIRDTADHLEALFAQHRVSRGEELQVVVDDQEGRQSIASIEAAWRRRNRASHVSDHGAGLNRSALTRETSGFANVQPSTPPGAGLKVSLVAVHDGAVRG